MAVDAGVIRSPDFRAGALWRSIVALGSSAVAVALVSAIAEAWEAPGARPLGALRGAAMAAVGAGALLGSAFVLRFGLTRAGIAADEAFVPDWAPQWARAAWTRCTRSKAATVATALAVGLLVGLLAVGLDDGDDGPQVASDDVVRFQNGAHVGDGESSRGGGSRDGNGGPGGGVPGSSGGATDDGSNGGSGGDGAGSDGGSGSGGASDDGGASGGGGGGGGGGTTTTTRPGGSYGCDVLDEYTGDVDALLESLGIDEDEITDEKCEEIEQALEDTEDLLNEVLEELLGVLPIPLPSVTTTTVTVPVTTTTVTIPPTTVPTLPVTTTSITLPL